MLLKDSNPTGVTDSTPVLVDCKPAMRMVGSKAPRTSISLPKISAMELRYSAWVNRLMLATWPALAHSTPASDAKTVKESKETVRLRIRDFRSLSNGNSGVNSSQRYRKEIDRKAVFTNSLHESRCLAVVYKDLGR